MTTHAIRELVRCECARPSNRFGPSFFELHVLEVARHCAALAPHLGANAGAVELAAYLHDLAAVRELACVPTHHRDGAALARGLLREHGFAEPLVATVCGAIERHPAPVPVGQGTAEEVCLSNADVMAQLARPAYWFFYLHHVRGLGEAEALAWWRGRADAAWRALVPEARAMVAGEHALVVRMLEAAGRPPGAGDDASPGGR